MESAVPPSAPVLKAYKALIQAKSITEEAADKDTSIAGIDLDPRWKTICEEIQGRIESLERMEGLIDDADTVESIGFRFLASRVAIAHLREIIELPNTLAAAEQINAKGTGDKTG